MVSIVTLIFYALAIQYERGGLWRVLWPLYVLTALLDVVANHTEVSLLLGSWPEPGVMTVSQRIPSMLKIPGRIGKLSYYVSVYLNFFSPTHDHIKEILRGAYGSSLKI